MDVMKGPYLPSSHPRGWHRASCRRHQTRIRMKESMFTKVSALVVALLFTLSFACAQVAPERVSYASGKVSQPLPFKPGETLVYDVNFSKFVFSGTIGELQLSVSNASDSSKPEMIELKAEAVSRGFFPALFGLKVRDRYNSVVDPNDFGLRTTTKLLDEGKLRREQKSVVDREAGRVRYTDRDLANEKTEPKIKEKPSPSWVQDLLSAIYFVRTQQLKEGDVLAVPISEGGEVYNIDIVVGKREEIKTVAGKFKAIQLNAKVFGGRYIRRSGEMLVWVTDDERRIPVHSRIKVSGTTITVDLKRMS
jgi:uncharacterized protein DUF3108